MEFQTMNLVRNEIPFIGGLQSESIKLDSQIECLEFHECLLAHSGREFQLDSLFTGVPTHLCMRLLEMHNNCIASDEDENSWFVKKILEVVQTQNYLFRNSESLRLVKIIFNHDSNASFRMPSTSSSHSDLASDEAEPLKPVISPVSCVYGFSLMPNLEQVIIGYDHYLPNASDIAQAFKPLAQFPYVKIVHEPTVEY